MQIDLSTGSEYHNIYDGPQGLQVRPGMLTELRIEDIGVSVPRSASGTNTKFVYGFSIESANSGQTFHYLFSVDSSNKCYQSIYDSQFYPLSYTLVGYLTPDAEPFSVAINYNQIVVNSRSLPYPLWGFIGGTLVKANSVESINPDTPALTLFPGRVCAFADRFAWAYANQVIFNDPGTEPRTICAPNAISFGGTVLDMFQSGEGGNLIVVCTDATYQIPPDGLAGYQFQGVIAKVPGYQGANSNNAATARGATIGLVKDGIIQLGDFAKSELTSYRKRRYLAQSVGPYASGDYRNGSILATDEGFVITINNKTCLVDLDAKMITWYYPASELGALTTWTGGNFDVIGLLKDSDGKTIFLTTTAVIEFFGIKDCGLTPTVAAPDPTRSVPAGYICKNVDTDPEMSPVVREITVSSDRPSKNVYSYVRSSLQSATVPAPPNAVVIGTTSWGVSGRYLEREFRSRRMQRAVRVDSPDMELAYIGGGTRVHEVIDLVTRGIGKNRPTN